jgi:hypothetical protein
MEPFALRIAVSLEQIAANRLQTRHSRNQLGQATYIHDGQGCWVWGPGRSTLKLRLFAGIVP